MGPEPCMPEVSENRWQVCLESASEHFSFAVGALYLKEIGMKSTDEVDVKARLETVENLMTSFHRRILNSDFLDAETKKKAKTKLDYLETRIAYPESIFN